jgi:hypothetical protein
MSSTRKTNRPQALKRASRPPRDLRAEKSTHGSDRPPERSAGPLSERGGPRAGSSNSKKTVPEIRIDPAAIRRAEKEAEITRLKAERASDADDIAAMLVTVAESDRERRAAWDRAGLLETRTRELDAELAEAMAQTEKAKAANAILQKDLAAARDENIRGAKALELATDRAHVAEESFADMATGLEQANEERDVDRERIRVLEKELSSVATKHDKVVEEAQATSVKARAEKELAEAAVTRLTRANADLQADRARKQALEAEVLGLKRDAGKKLEETVAITEKARSETTEARTLTAAARAEAVTAKSDAATARAEAAAAKTEAEAARAQLLAARGEANLALAKVTRLESAHAKAMTVLADIVKQETAHATQRGRNIDQVRRHLSGEDNDGKENGPPGSKRPPRA